MVNKITTPVGALELINKTNEVIDAIAVDQTFDGTSDNAQSGVAIQGELSANYQPKSTAVTHTTSTAVGSGTQPVYIASNGVATATTYALNKSVPSDAVFTDTTYSDFTGATSITGGAAGLVPAPSSGDNDKILTGGAIWSDVKTVNNSSLLGSGDVPLTLVTFRDWS